MFPRWIEGDTQVRITKVLGAVAAAATIAMFGLVADAQEKAAPKAAPAAKAAKPKPPPKCNSLKDEAACKARDDCNWVAAVMDKAGKKVTRKAYCRANPKPKKK